jgi:hypothetical protein
MKRTIFLSLFVFFITILFADEEINLSKIPGPPILPVPRICSSQLKSTVQTTNTTVLENVVSATISESQLSINFKKSVGTATIIVRDAENNEVYFESFNSSYSNNLVIPCSSWSAGSYTLTITSGSTTLMGFIDLK